MIQDGTKRPVDRTLRLAGWMLISEAPLMDRQFRPSHIIGRTVLGTEVEAWYRADGDYEDRWTDARGVACYNLTHFKRSAKA